MADVTVLTSGPRTASSIVGAGNVGFNPITLRGVTFSSMEHPSTFAIGDVEHTIVSQKMPGGGIVAQGFGPHPQPITIQGTIYGSSVKPKMGLLLAYATDGQEGVLSWGDQAYYCRVNRLTPAYIHDWRAGFTVALVITRSANGALTTGSDRAVSPDQTLDDSLSGAQDQLPDLYNTVTALPGATSSVSGVDTAIQQAVQIRQQTGPLGLASSSGIASLSGSIGAALSQAQALQVQVPGVTAGALAALRLTSLLTIAQSVTNAGRQTATTTMPGGTNLFQLAAQNGDVTQAFAYMAGNGLGSPFLPKGASSAIQTFGL